MRAAKKAIDYAEKRKQAIDRATHLREQRTLGVADEECTFAPARCVEKWVHCPAVGVGDPDFITVLLGTQAARGWWRTRHPRLTHTVLIIRTAVTPVHHTMPARGGYTVPARSYTVPANLSFNQPQPRPRLFSRHLNFPQNQQTQGPRPRPPGRLRPVRQGCLLRQAPRRRSPAPFRRRFRRSRTTPGC